MPQADATFTGSIPDIYDRCLGPTLFEPFARDLANRFKGWEGALLETAAGTGRVTRALAEAVGPRATIVATDLNEPMLARAAQIVTAKNVQWRQADAQALPFDRDGFEAIVCQFGVMFFPDKPAAFAEARRVLKPGGRFVFNVWDKIEANELALVVHETVASLFPDDPPGFLARTPYGFHDLGPIRAALTRAGFGAVELETVATTTLAASGKAIAEGLCMGSPLAAEIQARRPGGLEDIAVEVAEAVVARFGTGPIEGAGRALVVTAS
ncbi:MAG TPA: methyltransferase domain-containing protein [Caulobacteraceae bacterium]|jgi:SAM-dependent methyltransferase|nr:methyltransferase domain-containing protein [Caulobacteraceae bacterium]